MGFYATKISANEFSVQSTKAIIFIANICNITINIILLLILLWVYKANGSRDKEWGQTQLPI